MEHGSTAKYEKLSSDSLSILRKGLQDLQLLIIDEISMVSSLMLTYIHLRLTEITGKHSLFGGASVIVLGDLLQLPPVKGNAPFMSLKPEEIRTSLESVGAVNLWHTFQYDELTINVRQAADQTYANLLANVRVGRLTEDDIQLLKSRLVAGASVHESATSLYEQLHASGLQPICLLSKVDACKQMNERMLQRLGVTTVSIASIDELDRVACSKTKQLADKKLKQLTSDASRTAGLETELKLAIGARVMLRRNIDMNKGLVNGCMGTVLGFTYAFDSSVKELKISFDSGLDIAISRINVPFELIKGVYVHRKQFPVSLAYAITVHKCQGLSLECAIIDLGESIFGPGMAYVALSRVTTLNGLHLLDLKVHRIVADSNSIIEYNRLRSLYRSDLPMLQIVNRPTNGAYVATATHHIDRGDQPLREPRGKKNTVCLTMQPKKTFENNDNVSCYANSIAQVLLNITEVTLSIQNSTQIESASSVTSQLQNLLKDITSTKSKLNSLPLRRAVGQQYTEARQRDAYEFLADLLNKLSSENSTVPQLFTGVEGSEERCVNDLCRNRSLSGHMPFKVVDLHFPSLDQSPITFKEMIEQWLPFDRNCPLCNASMERRTVIRTAPHFLILSICIFQRSNQRVSRPITGFCANNVRIAGERYKAISAVCHSGATTESGHYWCYLRSGNAWLAVSDENISIKQRFVTKLKNVYLIVLEKVSDAATEE